MPAAEVAVDADLVRRLLRAQHPDLADLPVVELANGWDNVMFRLGDDLTVRLPRRAQAVDLVRNEQRWLPSLAGRLPLPIPAPVRHGGPGEGYPWPWSICPRMPGAVAGHRPEGDRLGHARDLGAFLAALHRPAPPDAPENPVRGGRLDDRDGLTQEHFMAVADVIDAPAAVDAWEHHLGLPVWRGVPLWLHGDLHPANGLVADGAGSAIIDFGDLTAGDPATDLAVAWMCLPAPVRPAFRVAAAVTDDDTWARARGWALSLAAVYVAFSADHPVLFQVGLTTIEEILHELAERPA